MPEKVAAPSYPCPLSFLAPIPLFARKYFSAVYIEVGSHPERLTSPGICSTVPTGEQVLSTHHKQIESSSVVAISVDLSRIEQNAASFRDLSTPGLVQTLMASIYSLRTT